MDKLNGHKQINEMACTMYADKMNEIVYPTVDRKQALKRIHEDYILEMKIMNDINNKMKDVKFIEKLKNNGYGNNYINDLKDDDKLRTMMSVCESGKVGF